MILIRAAQRGARLAVNQAGEREHANVLTVVANESYERFVATLQSEIALEYRQEIEARYGRSIAELSDEQRAAVAAEYGEGILPPQPANARRPGVTRLRKEYTLRPEFKELWERIKHKTRYAVAIDTEKLIQDVLAELGSVDVRPPRMTITKVSLEADAENAFQAQVLSAAKSVKSLARRFPLPNLVEVMADQMQHTIPPVRLTRKTLLEILRRAPARSQQEMVENPHEFAAAAVRILKAKLADQLYEESTYLPSS